MSLFMFQPLRNQGLVIVCVTWLLSMASQASGKYQVAIWFFADEAHRSRWAANPGRNLHLAAGNGLATRQNQRDNRPQPRYTGSAN